MQLKRFGDTFYKNSLCSGQEGLGSEIQDCRGVFVVCFIGAMLIYDSSFTVSALLSAGNSFIMLTPWTCYARPQHLTDVKYDALEVS